MNILRYLLLSLVFTLVAAYTALWIALPDPLHSHVVGRPPLITEQKSSELRLKRSGEAILGRGGL
ncbi:hypothetical protein L0Y47_01330 [Ectopseudomonas composti]